MAHSRPNFIWGKRLERARCGRGFDGDMTTQQRHEIEKSVGWILQCPFGTKLDAQQIRLIRVQVNRRRCFHTQVRVAVECLQWVKASVSRNYAACAH
jgi:hypothetical protein